MYIARGTPGQIALDLGIELQPVRAVLLLLLASASGVYGISPPSTTPRPAGTAPAAPSSRTGLGAAGVRLDVPVRRVDRLPDAVQIGLAVRRTRRAIARRLRRDAAVTASSQRTSRCPQSSRE